ncbi:MAG: hypothetical protein WCF67_12265, partial [Chitinophagaceae bacterium]
IKQTVMNTYNENLNASIVSSLQSQELEQKKVYSQLNASMFSLYYAEGAALDAADKFGAAWNDLANKTVIKEQAMNSSNISNNQLSSTNTANDNLKQSVTNTSVCAANVQIATTAVIRLASDMGGIFSIVNAADFESDIYKQAKDARELMDDTAYSAELASQLAMEVSIHTSGVSGNTVLDRSKSTNGLMNNMLKIASADFDNSVQAVSGANTARSTISAEEKLAEGAFEDVSVNYRATKAAYDSAKKELNQGLTVPAAQITNTSFEVKFNLIKEVFDRDETKKDSPVQDYYLFIAKESKKLIFSVSQASALQDVQDQRIKISLLDHEKSWVKRTIDINKAGEDNAPTALKDTDGALIKPGNSYVVFVFATYKDAYKRRVNDFDDFLSAPSEPFVLVSQLKAASNIEVLKPEDEDSVKQHASHKVTFSVDQVPDAAVQYRCIFLRVNDTIKGLLTKSSLKSLHEEIEAMLKNGDESDPGATNLKTINLISTK